MSQEFAHSAVNDASKLGTFSMVAILTGFTFFSASMWTGGAMALGLSFHTFILASFLGALVLGVYSSIMAYMGAKMGLSSHLLSHYAFGKKGSFLSSFLLALTQTGWFGVGIALFALGIHHATGISLPLLVVVAGCLMTTSAYFGMKALSWVSFIAVPAILILGVYSVVKIAHGPTGLPWDWTKISGTPLSFSTALGMAVSSFISGGTLVADYTRFAKSPKIAVGSTLVAFFLGSLLMFFLGAMGARSYGIADISEVLTQQGLIGAGVMVLGFNIWTTNDNALYSAGLGMANITQRSKRLWVLICGLLGTAFSLSLNAHFIGWLSFLNILLPPLGAVLIGHYFWIDRKAYQRPLSENPMIVWNSVIAWLLGVLGSFFMPGLQTFNGIAVTWGALIVLKTLFPPQEPVDVPLKESLHVD